MKIKTLQEYRLKGERNNKPRQPIIWEDKLYVVFVYDKKGFVESKIQCLSLDKFELIWEYQHNHVINNILISTHNTLVASCMDGQICCFDLNNGQQIWGFTTQESNIGPVSNEFDKKIVFSGIQARATSTWCLDIKDGKEVWKQPNSGHSYIPAIHNGLIYNSIANDLFCLSLEDGLIKWSHHEPKTYLFNPKVFENFVLAYGHGLINFYDLSSGQLKMAIDTGEQSSIREVIMDKGNIYFGDEKGFFYCYQISSPQETKWKFKSNAGIQTVPVIKGENVMFLNDDSKLIVLDKNTGALNFEMKLKGAGNVSGITLANNSIYFSCGGGYVYECKEE